MTTWCLKTLAALAGSLPSHKPLPSTHHESSCPCLAGPQVEQAEQCQRDVQGTILNRKPFCQWSSNTPKALQSKLLEQTLSGNQQKLWKSWHLLTSETANPQSPTFECNCQGERNLYLVLDLGATLFSKSLHSRTVQGLFCSKCWLHVVNLGESCDESYIGATFLFEAPSFGPLALIDFMQNSHLDLPMPSGGLLQMFPWHNPSWFRAPNNKQQQTYLRSKRGSHDNTSSIFHVALSPWFSRLT